MNEVESIKCQSYNADDKETKQNIPLLTTQTEKKCVKLKENHFRMINHGMIRINARYKNVINKTKRREGNSIN